MAPPRSGSDNTPTVSWSTREASIINPVVVDLLRIFALHSIQFYLNSSVFYHPGQENCNADNASCLFYISETSLLIHMSATYPQLQSLWQISLLPPDLLSCISSTLCRNPCERAPLKIRNSRSSTRNGPTFFHPVDQTCYPRSIKPSHRYYPII